MVKRLVVLASGLALLGGAGCISGDWGLDTPVHMTSLSRSQPVDKEKSLDVNIDYGTGELTFAPVDPPTLYKLDLEYDANRFTPNFHYNVGGDSGRLDLEVTPNKRFRSHTKCHLDMALTDRLPIDMRLKTGVSESKIDLSGLQLHRLSVEGGVGQTVLSFTKANPIACQDITLRSGVGEFKVVGLGNANTSRLLFEGGIGSARLDLTGAWRRDAEVEMRLGIGEVTLIAPPEVGVEIEGQKSFLSSLHLDNFERFEGRHRSRNYDKAKYRMLVRVHTGIGSLRVRWA